MTQIAIDGGTRTGKTSTAKRVAQQLELPHISTGLVYRALAWAIIDLGLDPSSARDCARVSAQLADGGLSFVDGDTVSISDQALGISELRHPRVTAASSVVAVHREARANLLELQRQAAKAGAVVEGRDIGTVVLPDADLKVFLTVSPEEHWRRAEHEGGIVEIDLARDQREASRAVAPMVPAADAITIDTSGLKVPEVVTIVIELLQQPAHRRRRHFDGPWDPSAS